MHCNAMLCISNSPIFNLAGLYLYHNVRQFSLRWLFVCDKWPGSPNGLDCCFNLCMGKQQVSFHKTVFGWCSNHWQTVDDDVSQVGKAPNWSSVDPVIGNLLWPCPTLSAVLQSAAPTLTHVTRSFLTGRQQQVFVKQTSIQRSSTKEWVKYPGRQESAT